MKGEKLWTRHGSTRYLWNEASVEAACRYVRDGQGADIPGSVLESRGSLFGTPQSGQRPEEWKWVWAWYDNDVAEADAKP